MSISAVFDTAATSDQLYSRARVNPSWTKLDSLEFADGSNTLNIWRITAADGPLVPWSATPTITIRNAETGDVIGTIEDVPSFPSDSNKLATFTGLDLSSAAGLAVSIEIADGDDVEAFCSGAVAVAPTPANALDARRIYIDLDEGGLIQSLGNKQPVTVVEAKVGTDGEWWLYFAQDGTAKAQSVGTTVTLIVKEDKKFDAATGLIQYDNWTPVGTGDGTYYVGKPFIGGSAIDALLHRNPPDVTDDIPSIDLIGEIVREGPAGTGKSKTFTFRIFHDLKQNGVLPAVDNTKWRRGTTAIPAGASEVSVVFGTPMTTIDYDIDATIFNTTDLGPLALALGPTIEQSTTGFTVLLTGAAQALTGSDLEDSSNYVLDWHVVAKSEGVLGIDLPSLSAGANKVLAGPLSGGSAAPTFRPLVLADLPDGIGGGGVAASPSTADVRLSLSSTVALPSALPAGDITAATSVYLHPFGGNRISTYDDGTAWQEHEITSPIAFSLTGTTAGDVIDLYVHWNGSALVITSSTWTDSQTRSVERVRFQGTWVKTGDTSKRWIGTVGISANGQSESTTISRLCYSAYNRRSNCLIARMTISAVEPYYIWGDASGDFREVYGDSTLGRSRVRIVVGDSEDGMRAQIRCMTYNSGTFVATAIGLNANTPYGDFQLVGTFNSSGTHQGVYTNFDESVPPGMHTVRWLEGSQNPSTSWVIYDHTYALPVFGMTVNIKQ